jgi:hypothetical protein
VSALRVSSASTTFLGAGLPRSERHSALQGWPASDHSMVGKAEVLGAGWGKESVTSGIQNNLLF